MKTLRVTNKVLIGFIFIFLLVLIGVSYAYFSALIEGSETTTTISSSGGTLRIYYSGGDTLTSNHMAPSDIPFLTKDFTVTGNNTTTQTMNYNVVLVIDTNTFTSDALKYKLTSVNSGANGTIIPSVTTLTQINTGEHSIILGDGSFVGTVGENKVHTYKLELLFPNEPYDQAIDQGKLFGAHLETNAIETPLLADLILDSFGGAASIAVAPESLFTSVSGAEEATMYKMNDDYGTSYYYRGAKASLNNNIIFAEHQWKIVRINGNGTIKIIYNGVCPNNTCTINVSGESTHMGLSSFNRGGDAKYLGYMYGGLEGVASTSRDEVETNETSSSIKIFLDNWYENNILGTGYEVYISDILICSDRRLSGELGRPSTDPGFGSSVTYYASKLKHWTRNQPSFICGRKNDMFTVSDTIVGNGALDYPIGLLTGSEAVVSGLTSKANNVSSYLQTSYRYSLIDPYIVK